MGGACSLHGDMRNAYKILVGKPERKEPLGRSNRRRQDNIKMYLKETGLGGCELDSSGSG
jgi:hypothetical protein